MGRSRLILLNSAAEPLVIPVRSRTLRIGRSRECDVVLADEHVSRHHARLTREKADHFALEDLGSVHGTFVNGKRIQGRSALENGDIISFVEGDVSIRFESDPGPSLSPFVLRRLLFAAGATLGIGGLVWLQMPTKAPEVGRAQGLVDDALRASEREDWIAVKRDLRSAAGILFQAGLLEKENLDQPVLAALAILDPTGEADLVDLLNRAEVVAESQHPLATASGTQKRCRLDEAEAAEMSECLRKELDFVLAELGESSTTVPDPWLPHIAGQLKDRRHFFEAILALDHDVIPLLERELQAAGISPLFHYLAFIESAYRPLADSHAGAAGIWQFIPRTARRYHLKVDGKIDQRRDPQLATRAAAAYLKDLRSHFADFEGSLLLAIAGYNYGEHKVDRALKRLDNPFGASPYWELVDRGLLPKETADYAPRFLAAALAGESGLPAAEALTEAGYGN